MGSRVLGLGSGPTYEALHNLGVPCAGPIIKIVEVGNLDSQAPTVGSCGNPRSQCDSSWHLRTLVLGRLDALGPGDPKSSTP